MKKILFLLILFAGCQQKTETVLPADEFISKYKSTKDALLLDVRTEQEVNEGTAADAVNIVYDEAFASKLDSLKKQPIFVYCKAGGRSAKAAAILRDKGYTEVYEVKGGFEQLKEAGLPVTQ